MFWWWVKSSGQNHSLMKIHFSCQVKSCLLNSFIFAVAAVTDFTTHFICKYIDVGMVCNVHFLCVYLMRDYDKTALLIYALMIYHILHFIATRWTDMTVQSFLSFHALDSYDEFKMVYNTQVWHAVEWHSSVDWYAFAFFYFCSFDDSMYCLFWYWCDDFAIFVSWCWFL